MGNTVIVIWQYCRWQMARNPWQWQQYTRRRFALHLHKNSTHSGSTFSVFSLFRRRFQNNNNTVTTKQQRPTTTKCDDMTVEWHGNRMQQPKPKARPWTLSSNHYWLGIVKPNPQKARKHKFLFLRQRQNNNSSNFSLTHSPELVPQNRRRR